ncbi:MAG TPA: ABC transporter permease [Nocardioides sp.]|uniref:ABC transporter permease n=1 Tax=Nocardioides sp. TaxID=35761 RepID=UPI002B874706|nr:ABC transporter permease [Nocardioides sp.]HQR27447.1 ABC transporter permease [Nocardioides sp.]
MRAFRATAWVELKLLVREPLTVMFVLVLPVVVLYVLNGVFGADPADPAVWEGESAIDFYTSAYVALVAATAGVLSLPVQLAGYREKGVLRRFRASSMPGAVLIGAHMCVAVVVAAAGALLVTVTALVGYDAQPPRSWPGVVVAFLVAAVAFAALGSLLGLLLPTARAAQGLGVLLFFVFMMVGGSGPPVEALPEGLQRASELLPATYAAALVRAPWLHASWDWAATVVLTVMLVGSLSLAAWRLAREELG